jgi:hypothetical protein
MNLSGICSLASAKGTMFARRHGPAILTGAGIVGFGATCVLVGRAALRAQDTVDHIQVNRKNIMEREITPEYSKDDKAKDMGNLFIKGGAQVIKIYTPAIVVGGVSVACIIAGHGIMRRQQAALVAAYGLLDAGFKAYRKRVEEELGAEKELQIYRGQRERTIGEGDDAQVCLINDPEDRVPSIYARFFDESSTSWQKQPEYNRMFLKSQEAWANQRLTAHGFVFLNEVLDDLGLPRCQVGQMVGWRKDAAERGTGDGFIDFGIDNIADENSRAFTNGLEHTVLLDFNVDGVITIDG